MTEYRARIGEIIMGKAGDELVAIALGSCVGVIIYDTKLIIAGMAHVALPEEILRNHKTEIKNVDVPGRYADTAIMELLRLLRLKGANKHNLRAKIAGGSKMFGTKGLLGPGLNIGDRNTDATIENLLLRGIKLVAKDVKGTLSRTLTFNIENSKLLIRKGFNVKIFKI